MGDSPIFLIMDRTYLIDTNLITSTPKLEPQSRQRGLISLQFHYRVTSYKQNIIHSSGKLNSPTKLMRPLLSAVLLSILVYIDPVRASETLACIQEYKASTSLDSAARSPVHASEIKNQIEGKLPPDSRIGRIYVSRLPIFDESNPTENNAVYRWANRFHGLTKIDTIQEELLFSSGEYYNSRKIEESARLLRNTGYLYDAVIIPVSHCNGVTDVEVITRDVWSFTPEVNFDRSGGNNNFGITLRESNLFGTGKLASISHKKDIDRVSTRIAYEDRNIRGTRVAARIAITDADDGRSGSARIRLPFYSLDSKRAWDIRIERVERTETQYLKGEKVTEIDRKIDEYQMSYGVSRGLVGKVTNRWLAGYTYLDDSFSPGDALPAPVMPTTGKRLSYPFLHYQSLEDDFTTAFNIDQIYRTEDLHLGHNFNFRIGYAATEFGSDSDRAVLSTSFSDTILYEEKVLLQHFFSVNGFWNFETERDEELIAQYEMRYFHRQTSLRSFFASISATYTHNLNSNQQVVLGGATGARGFANRFQTGDRRLLLTLEERQYTNWHFLNLVRPGFALFLDAGRVWQPGVNQNLENKYLVDAGFGIRLASSKADVGSVIHIDFAFPLTNRHEADVDSVQITVKVKKRL